MDPVFLPNAGGPPIELRPSFRTWLALEAAHGGSIGALYLALQTARVQLKVCHDLVYQCARNAGSELTYDEIGERLYALGLFRVEELARALFEDICKPAPPPEESQAQEGPRAGVPFG